MEWQRRYQKCTFDALGFFHAVRVCWVGAGREVEQDHWQGRGWGPTQDGEAPAELPNGSSVCRAPNGTETSKVVGKHPFPSPTKGKVDLFPSRKPACQE